MPDSYPPRGPVWVLLLDVLFLFGCSSNESSIAPSSPEDKPPPYLVVSDQGTTSEGVVAKEIIGVDPVDAIGAVTVSVRVGTSNWSGGFFQTAVMAELYRELGYQVSTDVQYRHDPTVAYKALREGVIDVWPNGRFPEHRTLFEDQVSDGSVEIVGNLYQAHEGLLVSKGGSGLISLVHLAETPELIEHFDHDQDGLANIGGCPDIWPCHDVIETIIAFNGWSDRLEQDEPAGPEEYFELAKHALSRAAAGEPVIQYSWYPSAIATEALEQDMLWLSLGAPGNAVNAYTDTGYLPGADLGLQLGESCTTDPCVLGWVSNSTQIVMNSRFGDSNPQIRRLNEIVKIDVADVAAQNRRYEAGESTEKDIEVHAREWISQNRTLVDEWIAEAKKSS